MRLCDLPSQIPGCCGETTPTSSERLSASFIGFGDLIPMQWVYTIEKEPGSPHFHFQQENRSFLGDGLPWVKVTVTLRVRKKTGIPTLLLTATARLHWSFDLPLDLPISWDYPQRLVPLHFLPSGPNLGWEFHLPRGTYFELLLSRIAVKVRMKARMHPCELPSTSRTRNNKAALEFYVFCTLKGHSPVRIL